MNRDTQNHNYENEYVRSAAEPEINYNQVKSDAIPEIPEEMPYHDYPEVPNSN